MENELITELPDEPPMTCEVQEEINRLDADCEAALDALSGKERKFVQLVVAGESKREAVRKAGWQLEHIDQKAHYVCKHPRVQLAMKMLQRKHALAFGRSAAWKREKLERLTAMAESQGNASHANGVMRTLLELDGDIRQGSGSAGGVSINIVGLDRGTVEIKQGSDSVTVASPPGNTIEGSATVIDDGDNRYDFL